MSKKSYLSNQILLMTLKTFDFFTDEEVAVYSEIIKKINEYEKAKKEGLPIQTLDEIKAEERQYKQHLSALISLYDDKPRTVNIKSVVDTRRIDPNNTPKGITWKTLKFSRRISEFCSEESRALGLSPNQITFDKIIVKWNSEDILRQIVINGFYVPILQPNGNVENLLFHIMTASAGQLRTDKVQFISDTAWSKIKDRLQCGLDWNKINEKGGINVNKYMAYMALPCSATEIWDIDIDRMIVVDDFEAPVKGVVDYITKDYQIIRCEKEVIIPHSDGCGMMLPKACGVQDENGKWYFDSGANFMIRGPYIKGLLSSFDFIRFCEVNNCEPILTDIYGKEWNLIEDDIQIILTKSQFKLWKYYKVDKNDPNDAQWAENEGWLKYKYYFKQCGCNICKTNYEEDEINDTEICYQMIQSIVDMTDDEIEQFIGQHKQKIIDISTDKWSMLRTLKAEEDSPNAYRRCLYHYHPLLRDGYTKDTLRSIKKRWIYDGKSAAIKCKNKRLFVIPDLYAACQFWFLGDKTPEGILHGDEVASVLIRNEDEVACLRSPHLSFEWSLNPVSKDPEVYTWFTTNGIYTSCHSLISRILQFDVDGDQLNVVTEKYLIEAAKRNIEKFDIVPLYYDMGKAGDRALSYEEYYFGLKRAHDYSGIGAVSNKITRVWAKDNCDRDVTKLLTYMNNLVIDAAKTGEVNGFENYPEINKRVNKATGGMNAKMPYFFQFTKNGRRETNQNRSYAKPNNSTMNRICQKFDDIPKQRLNMKMAGVAPFNYKMMLSSSEFEYFNDVVQLFCELNRMNLSNVIESTNELNVTDIVNKINYDSVKEYIIEEIEKICTLEEAYPSIVCYLFAGQNSDKATYKQMFWRIFGNIAERNILHNIKYGTVCPKCGMHYPKWSSHSCAKKMAGMVCCEDCGEWVIRTGPRQTRCPECYKKYRMTYDKERHRRAYVKKNN